MIGTKDRMGVNGMSESITTIKKLRQGRNLVLVIFAIYVAWLVFGAKVFG